MDTLDEKWKKQKVGFGAPESQQITFAGSLFAVRAIANEWDQY
jgi:hypothetical protein